MTDEVESEPGIEAPLVAPRRRGRRRIVLLALALFPCLLAAGAWIGWLQLDRWSRAPYGTAGRHTLDITPGARTHDIVQRLQQDGLVSGEWPLIVWLRLHNRARGLQAGHYVLQTPISPTRLVAVLGHGAFERSLTIPEGWTAAQIARRLAAEGWIDDEAVWLNLVAQPLPEGATGEALLQGAEGYCFPDTYRFDAGTSATTILARMVGSFRRVWAGARPGERDPRSENLTMREVVTLASMIEREARRPDEMPAIASVYLNRIAKKMKLQCCATVRYALGGVWDRDLRLGDLKVDSPYNTYLHAGLPPGPIANPGRPAIEAVLRPAAEDFLFYVYDGNGHHVFSRTYEEHLKAIHAIRARAPQAVIGAQDRE